MLALSAPRVHTVNGTMYRQLELDNARLKKAGDAMAEALSGNNHLTSAEIGQKLAPNGIQASGHRLAYIMRKNRWEGWISSCGFLKSFLVWKWRGYRTVVSQLMFPLFPIGMAQ